MRANEAAQSSLVSQCAQKPEAWTDQFGCKWSEGVKGVQAPVGYRGHRRSRTHGLRYMYVFF